MDNFDKYGDRFPTMCSRCESNYSPDKFVMGDLVNAIRDMQRQADRCLKYAGDKWENDDHFTLEKIEGRMANILKGLGMEPADVEYGEEI
jgi:hypothetical protein